MVIFSIGIIAIGLLNLGLIMSLAKPRYAIWPPPKAWSWQFMFTWGCFLGFTGSLIYVAVADWNQGLYQHWCRYIIGAVFLLPGWWVARQGFWQLGMHRNAGLKGKLLTTGIYAKSRNPQYVGDILILIGLAIMSNSILVAILAVGGVLALLLTPLAEEPWLETQYGQAYREYKAQVPRFYAFLRKLNLK